MTKEYKVLVSEVLDYYLREDWTLRETLIKEMNDELKITEDGQYYIDVRFNSDPNEGLLQNYFCITFNGN